jgi:glycosyltransferase involved in cell wall biosynthesis
VSVIMAARDAAGVIADAVRSIEAQDYGEPIEIVIAVPPDDPTRSALAPFGDRVRVVDNPGLTAPRGLNAAIAGSTGDVVVRCDAGAALPPSYVSTAVTTLAETGAEVVGGVQRALGRTAVERAIAIAQTTPLGVGDARYRLGGEAGPVDTVYLGVFPRRVLDRHLGYSEDLDRTQDYELNHRIRAAGGTVWFDPRLVVNYRPRSSLRALWRQYFAYGRGRRRVAARHRGSLRWRQLVAPALVLGLVGSAVAAVLRLGRVAAVVPVVYAGSVVLAGLWLSLSRRDAAGLLTPLGLTVMHLAWGLGFVTGRR